jgi:hypothetical protein
MNDKYSEITKWYTGKALGIIQTYVLPTLRQAEIEGEWPKGASRKVKAALNKQSVAKRFADANDIHRVRGSNYRPQDGDQGLLEDVSSVRGRHSFESKQLRGWYLVFWMEFGQFENSTQAQTLVEQLAPFCVNDTERAALARSKQWADDFAPIAALVAELDSRRPKPTIVCKTLSPLQLSNVGKALAVDLSNVEPCPMVMVWVEQINPKTGKTYKITMPELKWPEGTRHGASKFSGGNKCESCGHAIKNPFNWCPLVGHTPTGPISLWVGRDCAKDLFNCDVSGEADYGR